MSHTTMMIDYQKTHFIQITFFVKKKEKNKPDAQDKLLRLVNNCNEYV